MREFRIAGLAVLVGLVLAAGCGGSEGGRASADRAGPPDACGLLTAEDLAAAFGRPARGDPRPAGAEEGAPAPRCSWEVGSDLRDVASVAVLTDRDAPAGRRSSEDYAAEAREAHEQALSDPEQAAWLPPTRFAPLPFDPHAAILQEWEDGAAVHLFVQGERRLQLLVSGPDAATAEALARSAAARLRS